MPPKGAPTAYFLFTQEQRLIVQKELNDAAAAAAAADGGDGNAKSVSVAVIAKEIGARWRALSDDERERYKQLAKARAEELAAAAAAAGDDAAEADDGEDDAAGDQGPAGPQLPRGVVKRIMAADPEFKRASADAVWLVTAAAEVLLESLAERAARQALSKRRKTVKLDDLLHVVKYDRRLVEAGLRDVMEDSTMFEAAAAAAAAKAAARGPPKAKAAAGGGDAGGEGGSPGGEAAGDGGGARGRKKGKAQQDDGKQRTLTAFFKAA